MQTTGNQQRALHGARPHTVRHEPPPSSLRSTSFLYPPSPYPPIAKMLWLLFAQNPKYASFLPTPAAACFTHVSPRSGDSHVSNGPCVPPNTTNFPLAMHAPKKLRATGINLLSNVLPQSAVLHISFFSMLWFSPPSIATLPLSNVT